MSGITQYFIGELWINFGGTGGTAIRLPMLQGSSFSCPENFDSLDIIANDASDINYTMGLRYPVIQAQVAITKEWLTAANLNAWFGLPLSARSSPFWDVASIGTVTYVTGMYSGATPVAWDITNAKISVLSLGCSATGAVGDARLEIMGTNVVTNATFASTAAPFLSAAARSNNMSHNWPNNPTRWDLTLTNNLSMNDEIPTHVDLTTAFEAPLEFNAGRFQASGSLQMQRHHITSATPVDGVPVTIDIKAPGALTPVHLQIINPLYQGRYGDSAQRGRKKGQLSFVAKGVEGGTGGSPIIIT